MKRLRAVLAKGLEATAALWPDIRVAFSWIPRPAVVLRDKPGLDAAGVRRRYRGLVAAIARHRDPRALARRCALPQGDAELLAGPVPVYDVGGLPRTNNELEQFFGSYRYHERRCSGRKVACPGRWCAARCGWWRRPRPGMRPVSGDLIPSDLRPGALRGSLERRQAVRTLGRRFRRDPAAYLRSLEDSLIKRTLPP